MKNVGDTDLGVNDTVSVYLSADQSIDALDILLQQYVITGLLSGDSVEYSDQYVFDNSFTEGSYYILFVVDKGNSVTEGNESNNLLKIKCDICRGATVDIIPQVIRIIVLRI